MQTPYTYIIDSWLNFSVGSVDNKDEHTLIYCFHTNDLIGLRLYTKTLLFHIFCTYHSEIDYLRVISKKKKMPVQDRNRIRVF